MNEKIKKKKKKSNTNICPFLIGSFHQWVFEKGVVFGGRYDDEKKLDENIKVKE